MKQLTLLVSKNNKVCLAVLATPEGVNDLKKYGLYVDSTPYNPDKVCDDATDLFQKFLDEKGLEE